jgi:hypothetical protein
MPFRIQGEVLVFRFVKAYPEEGETRDQVQSMKNCNRETESLH